MGLDLQVAPWWTDRDRKRKQIGNPKINGESHGVYLLILVDARM